MGPGGTAGEKDAFKDIDWNLRDEDVPCLLDDKPSQSVIFSAAGDKLLVWRGEESVCTRFAISASPPAPIGERSAVFTENGVKREAATCGRECQTRRFE